MRVSVIIPTLNEGERIGGLLRSIKAAPFRDKEIIVVDGGSTDNTVEIAKAEGATVIQEVGPRKGPGNARNEGARRAAGEILCFIDADEKGVNGEFFERAMKHFEDEDVVAVLASLEILPSTPFRKWYLSGRSSSFSRLADSKLYGLTPSFTFIRKTVFEGLGGFPAVGTGEDDILCSKLGEYLASNPSKRWVQEQGAVRYDGSALTLREYFRQSMWYGRSALPYFRVSGRGLVSRLLIAGSPLVYAVSLTSLFLVPVSKWFLVPFCFYLPKLALSLYDTLRDRNLYRLLTPFMDFVKGWGHLFGLMQYLFGFRKMSR